MEDILSAANEYAGRGWQVFPLKPRSKEPATLRGFYSATNNPETIKRWFGGDHPWNIAVRTGLASGVFVLDVDGKDGVESLFDLLATYGRRPETLISTTGSGWHLWFRAVADIQLDIRADGGYVAAPPSIHRNGKGYRWANDLSVARAPDWLIDLARRKPEPPAPSSTVLPLRSSIILGSSDAYGRTALAAEVRRVALAPRGCRNDALNRSSFACHQLVAGQELRGDEVHDGLVGASYANGLIADDGLRSVENTIRSGAIAGMKCPRDRHGRRR